MYKVLIADDEMLIRQGLASFFKEDERFEVCALAEDGEEALKMARACTPDLVLADINMPFMDGLTFVETLKKEQPQITIVIVTGYDEFQFAQRALRLNVEDYILKPVSKKDFTALLDKIARKMEEEQLRNRHLAWAEKELAVHHDYLADQFFARWIGGELDELEARDQLEFLQLQIPQEYDVLLLALRENADLTDREGEEDANLIFLACQDLIREVLKTHCEFFLVRLPSDHMAVVTRRMKPEQQWAQITQELYKNLHESFRMEVLTCLLHGDAPDAMPSLLEKGEEELTAQSNYSGLVLEAIHIVEREMSDPELSLLSVSEKLHVSPQYLSRLFHGQTGITFVSYLTMQRQRRAMMLLADPSLKLYQIAEQTGYTTQHYFSNVFKKTMGISPGEYRRSLRIGEGEDE